MAADAERSASDATGCPLDPDTGAVETRPAVPRPAVPSALVPSPVIPSPVIPTADVPGAAVYPVVAVLDVVAFGALADRDAVEPDAYVFGAAATPEAVTEEPALALHGFAVLLCAPSALAVLLCAPSGLAALLCAPSGLAALIGPKFNPPPSNDVCPGIIGLALEHAEEFAAPAPPMAADGFAAPAPAIAGFCELLAVVPVVAKGEVAGMLGIGMGDITLCAAAELTPRAAPRLTASARKPLISVCAFAMQNFRACSGRRDAALVRNESKPIGTRSKLLLAAFSDGSTSENWARILPSSGRLPTHGIG